MNLLRKLFDLDKEEIWRQLGEEMKARFQEGNWRKGSRVQVDAGEWTVTLDIHTVSSGHSHQHFTRLRAPYVNRDGFRFTIYRKGFFSGIAKSFGMQDVEVGYPDFDESFIIKGNDEAKLRSLFGNRRIRELLEIQPKVHFAVKDNEGIFGPKFPEDVDELCFQVRGVIKDIPQLKQLFELFAEVLQQLCHIGSAYEKDPNIEL
jgi:hypothetical protein